MQVEIPNRWTGAIILSGEAESVKDLLQKNRGANLSCAYLSGAYLSGADLSGADLSCADLSCAKYICPSLILLASWGKVSDALCLALMRYDAANHPDPEKFLEWAKGGSCPYSDGRFVRSAYFTEKRELIKEDFLSIPVKSAYELMTELFKEKCK